MKQIILAVVAMVLLSNALSNAAAQEARAWAPADVTIKTSWAEKVTPENAWPEYPRPQLVRKQWTNLNGLWDYAITALDGKPENWDGKILVPYALESSLSGVGKPLEKGQALWYRRSFDQGVGDGRLMLNFEAVDYSCQVWVNDKEVGSHTGGNLPFRFDVTDALRDGANEIKLRIEDYANDGGKFQLRGKQMRKPKGIWYTPVSGIWQTVWLEQVPDSHIEAIKVNTQIDPAVVSVAVTVGGNVGRSAGQNARVTLRDGDKVLASGQGRRNVILPVADAEYWSPSNPKLYDLTVELLSADGSVIDSVESYTGIREVGEKIGSHGKLVLTLNGEEIFHWGPLDQGWWPAGLLTPPSDEAMRWDVDYLKQAGFNMIRKHIKVEPRRYYAYCDQVGIMLWQDQVSGGIGGKEWPEKWVRLHKPEQIPDAQWPDWAHARYMAELKGMVDSLYNHPSIVCWVPFNERWGQHRTMEVGQWIVDYDPTRHINIASGGNFHPVGHIADEHAYPYPKFPVGNKLYDGYVHIVGEFGGHGFPVAGHRWKDTDKNWGYGGLPKDEADYLGRFKKSLQMLGDLKKKGIAGAVYTQTTDVEVEINGLVTYDRKVTKIPAEDLSKMSQQLLDGMMSTKKE